MNRRWTYILIGVLLILSLACDLLTDETPTPIIVTEEKGDTPTPSGPTPSPTLTPMPPTSTPRSADTPPESGGGATLTFQNYSGEPVCYIAISPTDSDNWGPNRLGGGERIPDQTSRAFDLTPGIYDLRVENCNAEVLYEERGFNIADDLTITSGGQGGTQGVITVLNQLNRSICFVFISPSSSDSWGNDRLDSDETILPGDRRDFWLPNESTYDIQALDCDNNVVLERDDVILQGSIFLDAEDTTTPPEPTDLTVTLENVSGRSVCFVFISSSSADSWGEDWLNSDEVIVNGGQRAFQMPPGTYDFLAQGCNEETLSDIREVTLSEDSVWTVGEPEVAAPTVNFVTDRYELQQGQCATLSWQVGNAARVRYRGQDVERQGSRVECPISTTRYELAVEDLAGAWSTYYVDITVVTGY
jgi:hypothetical protein